MTLLLVALLSINHVAAAIAPVTYYEVWRNTTNDPATAVRIEQWVTATNYDDDSSLAAGQYYYYWIRALSYEEYDDNYYVYSNIDGPGPAWRSVSQGELIDRIHLSWNPVTDICSEIAVDTQSAVGWTGDSDSVYFADPNLKSAIESVLGTVDPTREDMLNLTSLDAHNRGIADLEGLEHAVNLVHLYLYENQLTNLPESIGNLGNLYFLALNDNYLTSLPESLCDLNKLIKFNVHNNQLTSIPESIGNLTNLSMLYLSSNQLISVPESIGDLTSLTYLSLSDNQLTGLPESIWNMNNLSSLFLDHNQFTSIPESIENMTNLSHLSVSDNRLTMLPVSIWNLNNLTLLYSHNNQLTCIPESIGSLTNLTHLSLGENPLTSVPESIWEMSNLTHFYLWSNRITTIPDSIGNLTRLKNLWLYDNQLISISPEIGNLRNLNQLYLDSNQFNTNFYCNIIPVVIRNNPTAEIYYDPNPNPITNDCLTGLSDMEIFLSHWLENNCNSDNNWCGGADINHVDDVNINDFAEFASYWLN